MAKPSPLPDPHDNVEPLDYKQQFQGQEPSKFVDPCEAASKASFKCMDQNGYDRTKVRHLLQFGLVLPTIAVHGLLPGIPRLQGRVARTPQRRSS
ncbi:hypothetical protein C8R46DRAFT_586288 [Mycena filopes]|nr:hypothetical protein C8R46DRAFT_586288 [Mycena filopes]